MKKSYYKLGVEAYKKGSLDEAIEYFTKSINANYRTADAYCTRGVVYGDKGNVEQEFSDYNKAIELDPNNVDAYNNLFYSDAILFLEQVRELEFRPYNTNRNIRAKYRGEAKLYPSLIPKIARYNHLEQQLGMHESILLSRNAL